MKKKWYIVLFVYGVYITASHAENYDLTTLEDRTDISQLMRDFHAIRLHFTAVPEEDKQLDKLKEAQYWTSKNVHLRKHCENFFKVTPHTVPTAHQRIKHLEILGYLTAEWSVRLLFEEVMIDREGQDTVGVEPPLDEWKQWQINAALYRGFPDFVRNDTTAASSLMKMKLKGVPEALWVDFEAGKMKPLREWYRQNKHRLDKVVEETWGEYAVLDKDMEPQSKNGKRRGIREARKLREPRRMPSGDKVSEEKKSLNNASVQWGILAAICVVIVIVVLNNRLSRKV